MTKTIILNENFGPMELSIILQLIKEEKINIIIPYPELDTEPYRQRQQDVLQKNQK